MSWDNTRRDSELADYERAVAREPRESLIIRVDKLEKALSAVQERLGRIDDEFSAFREHVARELGL